jgi:hypothetical protein
MYILIDHSISDPAAFWGSGEQVMRMPPGVKLHHTFPTRDGTKAVCVWEADSIDTLRGFIEPIVGRVSQNEYLEVENKEGVATPSGVQAARVPA